MTAAEQRTCPACGTQFTWTPAAPRQKFCSTRCRQRWWDRERRRERRHRRHADDPPQPDDPRRDDDQRQPDDGARPAAASTAAACPHCGKPVAIVAWLVPPAAASVRLPARHAGPARQATNSDRTATLKISPPGEFR